MATNKKEITEEQIETVIKNFRGAMGWMRAGIKTEEPKKSKKPKIKKRTHRRQLLRDNVNTEILNITEELKK